MSRRNSQTRFSSSDEDHRTTSSLSPPRPFFLAGRSSSDRGSWSSSTEIEAPSDSDRDNSARAPAASRAPMASPSSVPTRRGHNRKRSNNNNYVPVDLNDSTPTTDSWSPISLYNPSPDSPPALPFRPPPSSFLFPFQAYPGNPDPGTHIPGLSRRSSIESISLLHRTRSMSDDEQPLPRPTAPFMAAGGASPVYRNSVAASINPDPTPIPRTNSGTFRTPFLSPASRPGSSLWSPPSYPNLPYVSSPNLNGSGSLLALPPSKPPLPSTRLPEKLTPSEKPWLSERERYVRASWWITFICIILGVAGAALLCYTGIRSVHRLQPNQLCPYMSEDFSSGTIDTTNTWSYDVELGGFGNGEFQMTTDSSINSYINNGQLYIMPTLSSQTLSQLSSRALSELADAPPAGGDNNGGTTGGTTGGDNGGTTTAGNTTTTDGTGNSTTSGNSTTTAPAAAAFTLPGCTVQDTNATACVVPGGATINPVMSARLHTKGHFSMQYGKVEVRAKLPRGDWLWPAIWMLPESETYGPWPLSGEIDIMEARGNSPAYPAQGNNFVRSTLNYGPLPSLITQVFGWFSLKRSSFASDFHTYGLEWDSQFMRFYTDSRVTAMLNVDVGKGFFRRGGYPATARNGSAQVVVENPWVNGTAAAPYDQPFYLIVNLAVGGTSGWFPDDVGGKPWVDGSLTAMTDFASAQSKWSATWPENPDDRAFRIDSVKMWTLC